MRPNVAKQARASWAAFGLSLALGAGFLAWYHDGTLVEQVERAERSYRSRRGILPLDEQVALQEHENHRLQSRLEELKGQTGIREIQPFVAPADLDAGEYFLVLYNQIRDQLLDRARNLSVADYDEFLGFGFLAGTPPQEDERHWLIMLQLVTKAVYLALNTEMSTISQVKVDLGQGVRVDLTGPGGRPPLVREYPFRLHVRGSLYDILWLLHQLSADQQTDAHAKLRGWLADDVTEQVRDALRAQGRTLADAGTGNEASPLIVRGLTIQGGNKTPDDQLSQLSVTFDLAGMEFLPPGERGVTPIAAPSVPIGRPAGAGGSGAQYRPTTPAGPSDYRPVARP